MSIAEIVGLALGGFFALATVLGYIRQGTVNAAQVTLELLKTQIDALNVQITELTHKNVTLQTTVDVLQGQVTQAAPVRELMEWSKASELERIHRQGIEHDENLASLTRLEGYMSRVESKLMRSED